ncbi:MAG: hypothetical protein QNL12_00855 [Acidimicrobiia bacterium]|nr:hypothetical protein [Acidimicrobiia bacterium]MDX2465836.1 hypothetical protein [Acidimicrobiia bacterium]
MDLTPDIVNEFVANAFPLTVDSDYSCVELAPDTAVARLAFDATNVRPGDIVPGLAGFGVADVSLWYAIFTEIGSNRWLSPAISLFTSFAPRSVRRSWRGAR